MSRAIDCGFDRKSEPEMARVYRAKDAQLASALQEPETRSEATEACAAS